MKPQLLKISKNLEQSFSIRMDRVPVFHNKWHYHPEVELIFIKKGRGTYLIGDAMASFEENDLFVLGSNLPHLFRYEGSEGENYSEAYVLHFLPSFFSDDFLSFPEMKVIKSLLSKSERGLRFKDDSEHNLLLTFKQLHEANSFDRILLFLQALGNIGNEYTHQTLCSIGFSHSYDAIDKDRLDKIYQYALGNYKKEITLEEISSVASLSVNSFCRYFKSRTNRTFSSFLLEIRIGQACKLLLETDLNIAQVCYETGFNNLSNFNRYFKKIIGQTPTQYKKKAKMSLAS